MSAPPGAEPLFLPGAAGSLYGLYHPPASGASTSAVLFIPPFADEMNKSRHLFAGAARQLAESNHGTLQIDLFGTGDSAGDFADARWELWLADLERAVEWLTSRSYRTVHVIALRLGALLAADLERCTRAALGKLVLWQPVPSGDGFLTQFLRLRLAASIIDSARQKETTEDLRRELASGKAVEVAGYLLAPALAQAIAARTLAAAPLQRFTSIDWIDVVPDAGRALSPASARCVATLRGTSLQVETHTVVGAPFWSTIEIETPAGLLDATTRLLRRAGAHA